MPISLPSIITLCFWAINRCLSTRYLRTFGNIDTVDAASPIFSARMASDTSSPFNSVTCIPSSNLTSTSAKPFSQMSDTCFSSSGDMPSLIAARPTALYMAPVSMCNIFRRFAIALERLVFPELTGPSIAINIWGQELFMLYLAISCVRSQPASIAF